VAAAQEAARHCPPETLESLERTLGEMSLRTASLLEKIWSSTAPSATEKPILCEIIDDLYTGRPLRTST
jgi:hypothetical protein